MRSASNARSLGLLVSTILILTRVDVEAAPSDENAWLSCVKKENCSSVELGCWYWQPVNKNHAEDMRAKYAPVCSKSINPGPQPSSSCQNGFCVNNPYPVQYWKQLDIPGKNGPIDKRIGECLRDANFRKDWGVGMEYVEFRQPYLDKVDDLINNGTFENDQSLENVIESTISCEDVIAGVKSLKK